MKLGNLEVYGVIYKITNKVNGKVYIGQTTQKNGFDSRYEAKGKDIERVYNFYNTRKALGHHYNKHLMSSIEKYGFNMFKVNKTLDIAFSKEELDLKERVWIQYYKSNNKFYGYNTFEGGKINPKDIESSAGDGVRTDIFRKSNSLPTYCKETDECFMSYLEIKNKYNINNIDKAKIISNKNGFKHSKGCLKLEFLSSKAVICLNDMKIFKNGQRASEFYGVGGKIGDVCKGNKKYIRCGDERLYFVYAGDYYSKLENMTDCENLNVIINNYLEYKEKASLNIKSNIEKRYYFMKKNENIIREMFLESKDVLFVVDKLNQLMGNSRIKIKEKHVIEFLSGRSNLTT